MEELGFEPRYFDVSVNVLSHHAILAKLEHRRAKTLEARKGVLIFKIVE